MRRDKLAKPTEQSLATQIFATRMRYAEGMSTQGRHNTWTVGLTLSGHCSYELNGRAVEAVTGDLLIFRPNVSVAWQVPAAADDARSEEHGDGWEITFATFHPLPHWLAWLNAQPYDGGFAKLHFEGDALRVMANLFANLVGVYETRWMMRDEESLNALELLLIRLHTLTSPEHHRLDVRMQDSVGLIHKKFASALTVPEIASAVELSPAYFSTLFTAATGTPPAAYVERVRMQRAAELLRYSAAPISVIAASVGYSDPFYFARRFHKYHGQSPTGFRTNDFNSRFIQHKPDDSGGSPKRK